MGAWGIGLGVLGVGVIGMWLLGPKSKNSADLPAGVPTLNQALRGTTMPITFGANRLPAQVTWTNNFRAVRQKSPGKGGKGGGSGGMGGAKGGGGQAVYEYYWDLMFHFGMMDQPSIMRRAWIGGDNVDQKVISQITAGWSDRVIEVFPIDTKITDSEVAQMKFTESFFSPGFPANSDLLEGWSFFESIVGAPALFPYTCYIGFEQYDLGMAPTVPQLAIEVVPVQAFSYDDLTATANTALEGWEAIFAAKGKSI